MAIGNNLVHDDDVRKFQSSVYLVNQGLDSILLINDYWIEKEYNT